MRLFTDFAWAIATVWQEARGESHAGRVAVAEVIRTRMKSGRWGTTVAEVVLAPYQFSGWNAKDPNRCLAAVLEDTDPVVKSCAEAWLESETSNVTDGATHYFNPAVVRPRWAEGAVQTATIGRHVFYKGVP